MFQSSPFEVFIGDFLDRFHTLVKTTGFQPIRKALTSHHGRAVVYLLRLGNNIFNAPDPDFFKINFAYSA